MYIIKLRIVVDRIDLPTQVAQLDNWSALLADGELKSSQVKARQAVYITWG